MMHVNTQKLFALADFLETVPPDDFSLDYWCERPAIPPTPPTKFLGFTIDPGERGCGYAGCAMGWAAHSNLFSDFRIFGTANGFETSYRGAVGWEAVDKLFGFDQCVPRAMRVLLNKDKGESATSMALFLFDGDSYVGEPTPHRVSERVRRVAQIIQRRQMRKAGAPKLELVA